MSFDPDKPSPARMYDFFLGGYHNFAIDRQAAEQIIALYPDAPLSARTNRAFLRRAVTFLLDQGIDQFLDIGSGIPTAGNVHEIVQRINPEARVVYVDIDPVAVAYSQTILQGTRNVTALHGDIRQPEELLSHAEVRSLIDLRRPLGLLAVAMLQFVPSDVEAHRAMRTLIGAIASGSYLVLSHATNEYMMEHIRDKGEAVYARSTNPSRLRSRAEIAELFAGLELVEPGLVMVPLWHPEGPDDLLLNTPEQSLFFAGVARKP